MYKKTIMIDLDGVLNNYTIYEENSIPGIKQGAREFVQIFNKTIEDVENFNVYWKNNRQGRH